jgi:periplasmic divalent cation tolerance protein
MNPYVLCLVTIDDLEKAGWIARILVEKKLAACVNIIPEIRSIYSWKDQIHDETERLMIIKTRKDLYDVLERTVRELHPYEVPEIIAIDIEKGLPDYLKWIHEVTSDH